MDEHGWANVEELIEGIAKDNDFNMEMLEEIVATDNKQRYSFNEDRTLIRANQGHSIPVDVELECLAPPDICAGLKRLEIPKVFQHISIIQSRVQLYLDEREYKCPEDRFRVDKGEPVVYNQYIVMTCHIFNVWHPEGVLIYGVLFRQHSCIHVI